jgi:hypothetical protein
MKEDEVSWVSSTLRLLDIKCIAYSFVGKPEGKHYLEDRCRW